MPEPDSTEPDDAGTDHDVPAELVELHEVLEYQAAVEQAR